MISTVHYGAERYVHVITLELRESTSTLLAGITNVFFHQFKLQINKILTDKHIEAS